MLFTQEFYSCFYSLCVSQVLIRNQVDIKLLLAEILFGIFKIFEIFKVSTVARMTRHFSLV